MKENEPVNYLAKLYRAHLELSDSIKKKIDDILKGATFYRPNDLANVYLNHREKPFPLPLKSTLGIHMKKMLEEVTFSGEVEPQALKPIEDEFWEYWNSIFENIRRTIGKDTLGELEKNYDKGTIKRILEALLDFEPFLKGSRDLLDSKDSKKAQSYFASKYRRAINAADILLKEGCLSDKQKREISVIKETHKNLLNRLLQIKEVEIDPIKEILLNHGARVSLLGSEFEPEAWMREYLTQFHTSYIIKRRQGKPGKIFLNALAIVIYRLLKEGRKKGVNVKDCKYLASDILTQSLRLPKRLPPDFVEKILYR